MEPGGASTFLLHQSDLEREAVVELRNRGEPNPCYPNQDRIESESYSGYQRVRDRNRGVERTDGWAGDPPPQETSRLELYLVSEAFVRSYCPLNYSVSPKRGYTARLANSTGYFCLGSSMVRPHEVIAPVDL